MKTLRNVGLGLLGAIVVGIVCYAVWFGRVKAPTIDFNRVVLQLAEFKSQHKLPHGDENGVAIGEARILAFRGRSSTAPLRTGRICITRFNQRMLFTVFPGKDLDAFLNFLLERELQTPIPKDTEYSVWGNQLTITQSSGPLIVSKQVLASWTPDSFDNQKTYLRWLLDR